MFEFSLEEVVFYLKDNKTHSAPILSRTIVENVHTKVSNSEQEDAFQKFGNDRKLYATIHGIFTEDKIFHSKPDLLDSL